jgi:hypothetical protein
MTIADRVLGLGKVIASSLLGTTKAVMLQIRGDGDVTDSDEDAEGSQNEPQYGALGFYFRPLPPDDNGHAEVVYVKFEDSMLPIGYRDLRISKKMNPKEGEIGIAHYDGGFVSMKRNDSENGTDITIYAVRNTPDGTPDKACCLAFNTKSGETNVTLAHESGTAVVMTKDGELVLRSDTGEARILLKGDQITMQAQKIICQANVCVGADPTTGAPLLAGAASQPSASLFLATP